MSWAGRGVGQGSVGGAGARWAWSAVMGPQIQFYMWDPFPCGKGLVRLSVPPSHVVLGVCSEQLPSGLGPNNCQG